jgi:hypothetical protein
MGHDARRTRARRPGLDLAERWRADGQGRRRPRTTSAAAPRLLEREHLRPANQALLTTTGVAAAKRAARRTALLRSTSRRSRATRRSAALVRPGRVVHRHEIAEVALAYQMYQLTGSTLAVGLISLTHLVPLLTLTVIGGAIADAVDRAA